MQIFCAFCKEIKKYPAEKRSFVNNRKRGLKDLGLGGE